MAASSPSPSNNGLSSVVTPSKNLRGLNKPKCIQCGNVARSRCPFQSCKGCCSRAENPCPIHVLKAAATSGEKSQAPSTPSSEPKATEGTPGSTSRVSSIRQLSSNFSQFNNLNATSRQRKPLTIKDAQALNEWRFTKLKEYKDRNIEVENEAFDRYMSNVNLLEEVFSFTSVPEEEVPEAAAAASEQNNEERIVSQVKLRLRSNSARTESFKKRIRETVKAGLLKLQKPGFGSSSDDQDEIQRQSKRKKWEEKGSALNEIIDKLNKARTEEDLKSCLEMKSKLYGQVSSNVASEKNSIFPGIYRKVEINEEAIQRIGKNLLSFDNVETLCSQREHPVDESEVQVAKKPQDHS